MLKIIIIVRSKPQITLIKLVISIIPVISCKKGKSLLKSSLLEGHFWRGWGGVLLLSGFANTCKIFSLHSEGHYFSGVCYFWNLNVST